MKTKLIAALVLCLALAPATFAVNRQQSGAGGIWNFYTTGPYGPPDNQVAPPSMGAGKLYVNQINLLGTDSITIGNATFYSLAKSNSASMLGCLYQDTLSAPVWQGIVAISSKGPLSIAAPDVTFTGPAAFYFAFAQTGGSSAVPVETFQTGNYPQIADIYNFNAVRWGSSPNYVDGLGCPSSLGDLTAISSSVNIPAFFLEP